MIKSRYKLDYSQADLPKSTPLRIIIKIDGHPAQDIRHVTSGTETAIEYSVPEFCCYTLIIGVPEEAPSRRVHWTHRLELADGDELTLAATDSKLVITKV